MYLRHAGPWFLGLVAHGSAVKGGWIPGCSDIDLQIYLRDAAFAPPAVWQSATAPRLPMELCAAIHRDLSAIDPSPFGYTQCYVFGERPQPHMGLIPGTYRVLAGAPPIEERTGDELREAAVRALDRLDPLRTFNPNDLLGHGAGRLPRHVRYLSTDVWPALYHALATLHDDPIRVWNLPKAEAIASLPADHPASGEIARFYATLRAYYPEQVSVERALTALAAGHAFLVEVAAWWRSAKLRTNGG